VFFNDFKRAIFPGYSKPDKQHDLAACSIVSAACQGALPGSYAMLVNLKSASQIAVLTL